MLWTQLKIFVLSFSWLILNGFPYKNELLKDVSGKECISLSFSNFSITAVQKLPLWIRLPPQLHPLKSTRRIRKMINEMMLMCCGSVSKLISFGGLAAMFWHTHFCWKSGAWLKKQQQKTVEPRFWNNKCCHIFTGTTGNILNSI